MIYSVSLRDFILFDTLDLVFNDGFNVFTGETGAGKSIIINAIDTALGAKVGKDFIKTGRKKASVELVFHLRADFPSDILAKNEIDVFDGELIISREITTSATRSRINGILVSQEVIKELRHYLVDIHSQHQTYSYMSSGSHINLLDGFGRTEHRQILETYRKSYQAFRDIEKEIETLNGRLKDSVQRKELLEYQINDIESASIASETEDSDVKGELNLLMNAEKLKELASVAYDALCGGDTDVTAALGAAVSALNKISVFDSSVNETADELNSACETINDIASSVRQYFEKIDNDPERLDFLYARLDVLERLKKKYGGSLQSASACLESLKKELGSIETASDNLEAMHEKLKYIKKEMTDNAQKLTESRRQSADVLSKLVMKKLELLELPKAKFAVDIKECDFGKNGSDRVEFLISTNISEPLKPLAKVASGGEISRVMLSLKTIFADADKVDTVIFDEIDTGISGKAADSVAKELVALSGLHQVMAVTHQGVIAAKAEKYFYVEKKQDDETIVTVRELTERDKLEALAFMTFGKLTPESVESAKLLL